MVGIIREMKILHVFYPSRVFIDKSVEVLIMIMKHYGSGSDCGDFYFQTDGCDLVTYIAHRLLCIQYNMKCA